MSEYPPGFIAMPVQDVIWTPAVEALLRLERPRGTAVRLLTGSVPIDAKRNRLTEEFLSEPKYGWMLLLDADHTYPTDMLRRLLGHNVPFVGVPYHRRTPPYESGLGTGCILVQRDVIERMPRPWFEFPRPGDPLYGAGEDGYFCNAVGNLGVELLADHDIDLGHVGVTVVDHRFASTYAALHPESPTCGHLCDSRSPGLAARVKALFGR